MVGRNRGPRGETHSIRQVWAFNFASEISRLDRCLQFHTIISIDTKFPGCIKTTPWGTTDEQLYGDFRFNVNQTKVIQLGLTALDESGGVGCSWEFNFSDFDPQIDTHSPSSISFLRDNGLDFDKLKKEGIPVNVFAASFLHVVLKNHVFRWVTFHGLYDIGYLMKAMGVVESLPESMSEFASIVVRAVGIVRDLKKHMARFCEGLEDGKLGLERLGQLLNQKRFGLKHHAGSDSLLTALLHRKMLQQFDLKSEICDGFLYGLSEKLKFLDMKTTKVYQNQKLRFVQIPYAMPTPVPVYYTPYYVRYY